MTQEFLGGESSEEREGEDEIVDTVDLDEATETEDSEDGEPQDIDVATETQDDEEEGPDIEETVKRKQEETRGILAECLIILLVATSSAIVGYSVFYSEDKDTSESLLTLVWTSQVGLVGGALGFYFGQNSGK